MKLLITIPTYWAHPDGHRPGDGVYDHPTPLNTPGTLGRTLESLARLREVGDATVAVVAAATAPELAVEVARQVRGVIDAASPAFSTELWSHRELEALRRRVTDAGRQDLASMLSLDGYSNIRNLCLALGRLDDADAVVHIDDDEVFDDPLFLRRVRHGLRSGAAGLAGFYVNGDGDYLLPEPRRPWERALGKVSAMNEGFRQIIGGPAGLRATPFAFGGNMITPRRLYRAVPFDPRVPRGEDVDYVLNAMLDGHHFLLDNRLAITHLPVPHSHPAWQQLRQDVPRFAYERDKLAAADLPPSALDPYPGPFLGEELVPRVERACALLAEEYRERGDEEAAARTDALAREAAQLSHPDALERYRAFQRRWLQLMVLLARLPSPGGHDG